MMRRKVLIVAALLFVSAAAQAQNEKDFSTVRFYPAVGPGNYLTVDGANVGGHLSTSYGLLFDFSTDTLVVRNPCPGIRDASFRCTNKKTNFVHVTGLAHLMTSISLLDRAQISFDLPLGFSDAQRFDTESAQGPNIEIKPREGFTFADARLAGKARLFGGADDPLAFSGVLYLTLPTATITSNGDCRDPEQCSYMGERGSQLGGYFVSEFSLPEFRVAANVGAAYRPKREFLTLEVGTEVRYGVAAQYDFTPLVHVLGEATGSANVVGAADYPFEARAAFSFGQDLLFTLGGGGGMWRDSGSPAYRLFAGVQYQPVHHDEDQDGLPDDRDACPADVEDRDGFMDTDGCPEPDNDGDGMTDKTDACDDEREDFDGFEDDDGCPDPDNDGDGVPDGYDSCEGVKEDRDGDRDDDGCPDLDTDRDGVADAIDKCADLPEDTDGLGDEDGCPEEDFDGDGTNDPDDACPDAAEWWNDILDQDGCPEDDTDNDTVPDQVDRCPDDVETLNGVADGDGCADGAMVVVLRGAVLLPTAKAIFDGEVLRGGPVLVDAVAGYVRRNHRRGALRVVMVAPEREPTAAARAAHLAGLLSKRLRTKVYSAHVPGTPRHLEIELLPEGWSELPRQLPSPAPAAAPGGSSTSSSASTPATASAPSAAPGADPPPNPAFPDTK